MLNDHRERFRKLTFRALALRQSATMSSPNLFMNDRTASSTNCHNNTWNFLSRSEGRRNSNAGINEIKVHVSVIKWDRVMSNFKRPKNREKL